MRAKIMGGMNSGRKDQGGKRTTEDCRSLDIHTFKRNGMLIAGKSCTTNWTRNVAVVASIKVRSEIDRLIFEYRHQHGEGEWKSINYPVKIEWTPCNYGGLRAWFNCPAKGCGRRVAKLFLGSAGIFACRHCYQLAYASQRENADDRATRQADKIRERLGWPQGILNGHGDKPKGMHWQTYRRLIFEHDTFVNISLLSMQNHIQMIRASLEK